MDIMSTKDYKELNTIQIEGAEGCGYCDDCGAYGWGTYLVKFPDGTSFEYDWDDHLGGGSEEGLQRKIMEHLGYVIERDIEWKGEDE